MDHYSRIDEIDGQAKDQVIGGTFALERPVHFHQTTSQEFLCSSTISLANARSGIWLLIKKLAPRRVWLPSYLCESMLEPVKRTAGSVRFYDVDYNLKITSTGWMSALRENDLVVMVDYFGFPCDASILAEAKDTGAWVVRDASQSLLSKAERDTADFVLYSPRKFIGVPDGGILRFHDPNFLQDLVLEDPPWEWWLKSYSAALERRDFDVGGREGSWFSLFQEANKQSPIGAFAMSDLSRRLLAGCDFERIASIRAENYLTLANELAELAIWPSLPCGVVPLGFPVRVSNRDSLLRELYRRQIYPPVHWPITGLVPERFRESHRLSSEIMTIPCDQRYTVDEMRRVADAVKSNF